MSVKYRKSFEPLFDVYLSKGKLTMVDLDELLNVNSFYKEIGKNNILHNLGSLLTDENADWLLPSHIYGLIIASDLHQSGISNEDFVELVEMINRLELDAFEMMLPKRSNRELALSTQKEFGFTKVKK